MSKAQKSKVLITGATGILGRALVLDALETDCEIFLPIRASDNEEAARRLSNCLGIEASTYDGKARAFPGNLTQPLLGLDTPVYDELRKNVEYIVHCAGDVSFNALDRERVFRNNVEGTRNLLMFAEACPNLRCFVHVSTAYVCGDAEGLMLEDELEQGQTFSTPYEESKYQAERLVRIYRDHLNLPIIVCRPSIILEDLEGLKHTRLPAINALILMLGNVMKSVKGSEAENKVLRIPANPAVVPDLVPIGYVTKSILRLMQDTRAYGKTYHLTNPASPPLQEFVEVLSDEIGDGACELQCVDPSNIAYAELNGFEKMLLLNIQPYLRHLFTKLTFDISNVMPLRQLGVMPECPPISRDVLINVIRDSIHYADR